MKKYILLSIISLGFTSCRLDDNINPSNPSVDTGSAEVRMVSAQVNAFRPQAQQMNELGNIFTSAWGGNNYYFGNPLTEANTLNVTNGFYQNIFGHTYNGLYNLNQIIVGKDAALKPNYVAMAKIQKGHQMQYLVDLYNNIPYTEAFNVSNITPKYDDAFSVYKGLMGELNEGIALIEANNYVAASSTYDAIMKGDMKKWEKFANTVKLRYLVRMSKSPKAEVKAFVQTELNKLSGAQFVDFNVTINPPFGFASFANQSPSYGFNGAQLFSGAANTNGYVIFRAEKYAAGLLNGDPGTRTAGVADPRASKIFVPVGSKIVGLVSGAPKISGMESDSFSALGGNLANTAAVGSVAPGYLMTIAESELLQAEAAIEFPGAGFGDAKTHWVNAITASFTFYGLTATNATTYIASISTLPNVGWDATPDKLAAIQYQRFIANMNINAMETYIDYLRTGYPNDIPLAANAVQPRRPYRLLYPAAEVGPNAANVPTVTLADLFTKNATTPFWNQN